MQGFKETEIGWIPENWDLVQFGDTFRIIKSQSFSRNKLTLVKTNLEIQNIHYGDIHAKFVNSILDLEKDEVPYVIDKFVKSESNQFLKNGDIIITDVSEDLVDVGKCVELKNVGSKKVIGGLHTIVARDKLNRIQPGFGAYIFKNDGVLHELRSIATGMSVYGISKGNLAKLKIPIPPKTEQTTIAHILSTIQKAIEKQQQLIDRTTELKKALMHKLFTEGTKGEPQKETEIGLVPESWEVVELSEIAEKPQYGFTDSAASQGNAKFLRITDITEIGVDWTSVPFCNVSENKIETYLLVDNDIVFARIGATTGKSYIIKNPPKAVYASYLIRVRTNADSLSPNFLIQFFQSNEYWKQIDSQKGSSLKGGVNGSILSKLLIPRPALSEQSTIAEAFESLDEKVENHTKKKTALESLFKTMLHELMTGKTRVSDVDFKKGYKIDEPIRMAAEPRYEYK